MSHTVPSWPQELRANIAASSAKGKLNDPGPSSLCFNGPDAAIDLQAALSIYRNDPHFYNRASFGICGLLFLVAAVLVLRTRFGPDTTWYAIAAFTALSMLPVYHRGHDAKILFFAVPACAMLWREGKRVGRLSFLLTFAAVATTAALPTAFLELLGRYLERDLGPRLGAFIPPTLAQLAPLSLLALGVLNLWVFWTRLAYTNEMTPAEPLESDPVLV